MPPGSSTHSTIIQPWRTSYDQVMYSTRDRLMCISIHRETSVPNSARTRPLGSGFTTESCSNPEVPSPPINSISLQRRNTSCMIHESVVTTEFSFFISVSPVFESRASCTLGRSCKRNGFGSHCPLRYIGLSWQVCRCARSKEYELLLAVNGTSHSFPSSNVGTRWRMNCSTYPQSNNLHGLQNNIQFNGMV